MSGQCFGCGVEFGVFKKEHGCKNCGFSFCNKCLNDKSIPVPKRNNTKHHVCHKCFKILTGMAPQNLEPQTYDLPEAYLKRMSALKEREAGGQSSHHTNSTGSGMALLEHLRRLDKPDREIALRLEKLKAENKPQDKVTDAQVRERLAQLKGQRFVPEKKPVYRPPDNRPQVKQVDDLIHQITEEVDIDSLRPDPVKDVEARLARLRQADGAKPFVDDNNMNGQDKAAISGNDLNKVDKMGAMGRGFCQDGRNIHVGKSGSSVGGAEPADVQDVQRLMSQTARELELDAKRAMRGIEQDKALMDKLREIQKQKADKVSTDSSNVDSDVDNIVQSGQAADSDDENMDLAAKRILQQYLDEVKIDEAVGVPSSDSKNSSSSASGKKGKNKKIGSQSSSISTNQKPSNRESPPLENLTDSDYDDSDELPYCCICTEDATLRCRDCDMDLYCQRCFRGCHEEMEITDHRTSPYKAPKGYR